jgi:predicted nucleotidyltransferase
MEGGLWPLGPVEGDYVETVEGMFFAVKGLIHPEGLVIAYLRYLPDEDGGRLKDGRRYRRLYDLEGTEKILRDGFPHYLNHVESKGLVLQSVPVERIARVYRPRERLRTLLRSPSSPLEEATAKLASAISKESGVPQDRLGVSGSTLIGLAGPASDIDLVAYGREEGRLVYHALSRLRGEHEWLKAYERETVAGVLENRWGDTGLDRANLAELECRKLLHGLVEGRDYFVRLVREPSQDTEAASKQLGRAVVRAEVAEADDSIYTPCTYIVEGSRILDPSHRYEVVRLMSYRGKYTEQVEVGEEVEARGTLEEVTCRGRRSYRLILGSRGDYLLPTSFLDR